MPKLMIVIGSTRPGRAGISVAEWFIDHARRQGEFDVEVADLAELNLPMLDEPNHPRLGQYTHQHTRDWSARVDAADAFVFITPEYNHGYPAALKNAIDYLHWEWSDKAVGFVSYGGVAAGTRALQQLKPVVSVLKLLPVSEAVNLPFFTQFIDEDGVLRPNEVMEQSADAMLQELLRVESALAPLRSSRAAARA
jgi:NAD(P)H-dependent FMN reductase